MPFWKKAEELMPKRAIKMPLQPRPRTNPKLLAYLKEQPAVTVSLKDVQKSLTRIGVSLSKRVSKNREKR
jgi:hypothetical protein